MSHSYNPFQGFTFVFFSLFYNYLLGIQKSANKIIQTSVAADKHYLKKLKCWTKKNVRIKRKIFADFSNCDGLMRNFFLIQNYGDVRNVAQSFFFNNK